MSAFVMVFPRISIQMRTTKSFNLDNGIGYPASTYKCLSIRPPIICKITNLFTPFKTVMKNSR